MCNFLIQMLLVPPQDSKTAQLETLTDTGPTSTQKVHSKYDSPLCFGKVGLPPGTFFNELHRKKCMHVVKGSHTKYHYGIGDPLPCDLPRGREGAGERGGGGKGREAEEHFHTWK